MNEQLFHPTPKGKNVIKLAPQSAHNYRASYIAFSAFLCLNYILPYLMRIEAGEETHRYNILTIVRLLGVAMYILILLKNYWPAHMHRHFIACWHITIMYTLPFSTTLSFLITGGNTAWLVNIVFAIIILSAITKGPHFAILVVLGILLGIAGYYSYALGGLAPIAIDLTTKQHLIYTCIAATLIGSLLKKQREAFVDTRLDALELFGKIIETEIQRILTMSKAYASNIQLYSSQLHIERTLPPEEYQEFYSIKVDKKVYLSLQETINGLMCDNARSAQALYRILATLRQEVDKDSFTKLSIRQCITDALSIYALTQDQKNNLFLNLDEDFEFHGAAYYMQHMLLNLLDNVFKHSKKNCTLEIWTANNRLYVKDNGAGIAKEALPYIFDPFFTTDQEAMGIGLTFCRLVMEAFGGIIICKSRQGSKSFTEFVLTFPTDVNNVPK
ncbi:MAG: sensor histidine kinase [Bacteroidota bacterium]